MRTIPPLAPMLSAALGAQALRGLNLALLALLCCSSFAAAQDLTPADIAAIPRLELVDSLYVVRGKALFVNLAKARTPDDWRRIPGIKGAWLKSPLKRGMTTLADVDGDGRYELFGEGGEGPGKCLFWCREADGTVRWKTEIHASGPDNNGVHCEDIDGDGKHEIVSVGNYLQVLDATTGAVKRERFIFADFYGASGADSTGDEVRFDYPYRLARCSDQKQRDIVVANGWSPGAPQPLRRASDGKPDSPKGGVQIIAYRPDGSIAWHYKHEGKGYRGGGHEFRAQDLDGDGRDEIIHSANGGLIVLNHDGTERWRKDNLGEHSDWIPIADVNGDGRLDIVVQQGGAKGFTHAFDAQTGNEHWRTADALQSQIQNLAHGRFRPNMPGRQIALSTINGCVLRLLDGRTGEVLSWPVNAPNDATLLRWNGLDIYNCAAHDADGDGVDEIFTWSTPKGGQLARVGREEITSDVEKALLVGVAAFRGDGTLRQYWNCYTPTADGIQWGASQWDMRQFHSPPKRWDADHNGIEEAYIETEQWIFLAEITDLRKAATQSPR